MTATEISEAVTLKYSDCRWCFAVPGANHIIDVVHPSTGRTVCFDRTLEDVQVEEPGAVRMLVDDFCEAKAARQHTPITWDDVSESRFTEMLECLPPALMLSGGFLVGEPWDHDAGNGQPRFQAFRRRSGKHYASSRPMTKAEFRKAMGT